MIAGTIGIVVLCIAVVMGERSALWFIAAPFLLAAILSIF